MKLKTIFNTKSSVTLFPYFSRDIAEFWRRWHISLSSWFRDYLYIPLGGSRGGTWMKVRNTFIIFIVSGFWHGANWTFIVWGALNAIYFLPLLLTDKHRDNLGIVAQGKYLPTLKELSSMILTFCLTMIAWVFFRADSIDQAIGYIRNIFSSSLFSFPEVWSNGTMIMLIIFIAIEWAGRERQYAISHVLVEQPRIYRWGFYMFICFMIFVYHGKPQEFIYFLQPAE
jgi:D-alanyl-lipoteichoic acid acyltransferase DltB (MBOAT superfamily)